MSSAGTMHSLPFGTNDLIVDPTQPKPDAAVTEVDKARRNNWELGTWYIHHLGVADAGEQTLSDLGTFTRDERMQLVVASTGLGAIAVGIGLVFARST